MEKYIHHLLSDLEAAKIKKPEKPDIKMLYPNHPALEYGLNHIVEWEMSPEIPMQELFGIELIQFPVAEKLSEIQMQKIVEGILSLWEEYNITAEFPENLPIQIKYKVLINRWKGSIQYISEGMMYLEFCNYVPDECPFGPEYCSCKNYEIEESELSNTSDINKDCPF